jgi:formate hydrogenlyase subunit 6/NADH:ubiquinone oxidoreductase subunit I
MAGFLKVLFNNVLNGPSTDPFPLGETFTPARFRGKVKINPELCMGCGICKHVCTAGAINIKQRPDQSGYDITVWHNSCCLCASCRTYCPVKAITLSNDWHNAHPQERKFEWLERQFMPYVSCVRCGFNMRQLPLEVAKKLYMHNKDVDPEQVIHLCPKCRQLEDAKHHIHEGAKHEHAHDETPGA